MYYPEEVIEEVRTRNDIVDIVSQYVNLKKKGANYFGLCPFHNEKSPSFSVSPSKQMYYCFGCGARRDRAAGDGIFEGSKGPGKLKKYAPGD